MHAAAVDLVGSGALLKIVALGLIGLWGAIVFLGLLGRRAAAAIVSALTAVGAALPFLTRPWLYLLDPAGLVEQYGAVVIREVMLSGALVACSTLALVSAPVAARRAWGWLLPMTLSVPPIAVFAWLVFQFRLFA